MGTSFGRVGEGCGRETIARSRRPPGGRPRPGDAGSTFPPERSTPQRPRPSRSATASEAAPDGSSTRRSSRSANAIASSISSSETSLDARDVLLDHGPGERAGRPHAQAVGDRARRRDADALARREGAARVVAVRGLDAHDLDAGLERVERDRAAGHEPAARDRRVEALERARVLGELERGGALPGRDERMVVGRNRRRSRARARSRRRARTRSSLSGSTSTTSAPSASVRAPLAARDVARASRSRRGSRARARRAPPPARGSPSCAPRRPAQSRGSVVIRLKAPRSLKAPIGWSDSGFSRSSKPGARRVAEQRRAHHVGSDAHARRDDRVEIELGLHAEREVARARRASERGEACATKPRGGRDAHAGPRGAPAPLLDAGLLRLRGRMARRLVRSASTIRSPPRARTASSCGRLRGRDRRRTRPRSAAASSSSRSSSSATASRRSSP